MEINSVQFSFQSPPVPGFGIQRGDVLHALARHFKARLPERGDNIVAVFDRTVLDTLEQVVTDQVAGGGFEPQSGPQPGRLDVGAVAGVLHSGPLRVVGSAPALLVVEGVAERIERPLPSRRGDVEASAGLQVAPSGEDMDVSASALLTVQHGRPGVAVGLQPRPSRLLELVEDSFDLFVGGVVVRCPGDHAGGVPVLEVQRVGDGGLL